METQELCRAAATLQVVQDLKTFADGHAAYQQLKADAEHGDETELAVYGCFDNDELQDVVAYIDGEAEMMSSMVKQIFVTLKAGLVESTIDGTLPHDMNELCVEHIYNVGLRANNDAGRSE